MGEPSQGAGGLSTFMNTPLVWLIRHGTSQANAGKATDHPQSIELTDLGREQARHIAEHFSNKMPRDAAKTIIVSPYVRTLHTAQPLIDQLRQSHQSVDVQVWPIQEFTYLSPARCRGTTAAQRQDWAEEYWQRADPDWDDGDGAETYRHLMQRVNDFSARLVSQVASGSGQILVFGHGMFFKAFVLGLEYGTMATPEAMRRYRQLESADPIHNAQILRIALDAQRKWHVLSDAGDEAGDA
jgi:2,3-bisphosphoglycerate-dependent phosphoglycerate mutase